MCLTTTRIFLKPEPKRSLLLAKAHDELVVIVGNVILFLSTTPQEKNGGKSCRRAGNVPREARNSVVLPVQRSNYAQVWKLTSSPRHYAVRYCTSREGFPSCDASYLAISSLAISILQDRINNYRQYSMW